MTRYRAFVSVAVGIALAVACSSQSTRNVGTDGGLADAGVGDDDDDVSPIADGSVEPTEDATGRGGSNGSGGREGLGGSEELGGMPGLGGLFGLGGLVIDIDGGPEPVDAGPLPDASPSSGGSGGIIEPPVTGASAFMVQYFTSFCEASARCCADQGDPVTADGCISALLPEVQEEFGDLDANPNLEFQPEYADACLATLETLGCDDAVPEVCLLALMGTQTPGGACTQDMECIPVPDGAVFCEIDPWNPDVGQVCVAYAGDQSDQPCSETCTYASGYQECFSTGGEFGKCFPSLGFFCSAEDGWTCQPSRAEGESCSYNEDCELGRACALNVCVPESQVGDPCDPTFGEPLVCAPDAYCTSVGECAAAQLTGASCVSDEECVSNYCNSSGTCESPTLLPCESMSML
jgi:hypothetical protein